MERCERQTDMRGAASTNLSHFDHHMLICMQLGFTIGDGKP